MGHLEDSDDIRCQMRDVRAQRDALTCRLEELAHGHRALQSRYDEAAALKDKCSRRVEELLCEVEDFRAIRSVGGALKARELRLSTIEIFRESDASRQWNRQYGCGQSSIPCICFM